MDGRLEALGGAQRPPQIKILDPNFDGFLSHISQPRPLKSVLQLHPADRQTNKQPGMCVISVSLSKCESRKVVQFKVCSENRLGQYSASVPLDRFPDPEAQKLTDINILRPRPTMCTG